MIEIPGYRVIRPLGRGGMATVYLALQESVQREVALKVMSPTLLGDAQFGERFLREARIAAKLRHPHVVQVHDVGHAGDYHYIAMEYLPGGPALTRNGSPREPRFALRVTREIAGALGYAQNKGVVHRDIKPDNILLREDGAAVLTDFGIARASDNSRMTRTGAIIGTPHYMSPEQARGLPLDGRADLYSLGIVFHELILGKVPYQADDSLAVGIMHITAPLPRLPPHLSSLQSLLDRMLAKEADQRFQSGAELAAAIERIERDLEGDPRDAPVFLPTRELSAVGDDALERSEPVLGRIDDLLDAPPPRRPLDSRGREPNRGRARPTSARPPRKSNSRRWVLGGLIVVLALGAAAWFNQDALRDLMPQTRMNDLLARADQALLENRLDGANGGARELYAAALALDPDSLPARQGLQRVGMRLLDSARAQLAANDVAAARASLAQARELSVPATEADALQRELDARESRGVELGALLDGAQRALREGHLDDGENSAVALYRRALAAEPGNAIAAAGLRDTLTALLDRARALATAGQYVEAAAQIEAVAAVDPAHLGLPDARARLAQAREERQAGLDAQLDEADRLSKAGKLTAPAKANARDLYLAVLAQDASNARAKDGLRRIAATLLGQAQRQMADFEFESAASLLDRAQQIDAGMPGLAAARTRLRDLERSRLPTSPDPKSADTQARIAQLLAEARTAAEAGNLLAPPGDSAYDKYRAVRTLDPENAQARSGLAGLPALAKQRFEEALGANRLLSARGTIDALSTLAPSDPALPGLRRRLARSLLGQAAEKLGANELKRAREAFDQARELDPTNPDLAAMQARLEQAGG